MSGNRRFRDRTEAGEQLGEALRERDIDVELVLAVPRGGLPVGRAVADALGVPLDIVVASKIGAPGNPEYAIGAVASDGTVWRNETAIRNTRADESYIGRERKREEATAREKADRYRRGRPTPEFAGRSVAVVDDGLATGATVRAGIAMLREAGVERIVLAVPVGPLDTVDELSALVDEVVCLETPGHFGGVGQFYERFDQVSDEAAMAYLADDEV